MTRVLQQADRFQDLLALGEHDAPYVFHTIFDQTSWRARRLSKKKFKLLKRSDAKLRALLDEGERVRYVTFGSDASFLESYFLGWALHYITRRAIVLTDRRFILLRIKAGWRPGRLVAQMRYPAITDVKRTLAGNTKFRLGDGRTRVFTGVPRGDRKFIQNLASWIGKTMERETAGMEEMCPHCYAVVHGRPAQCSLCGGRFKSARRAGLLSLIFPGFGDLYMGHWHFAIGEVVVAALIWLNVLLPDPDVPLTPLGLLVVAAFIVVVIHGLDAIVTWYMARKGIHPAAK